MYLMTKVRQFGQRDTLARDTSAAETVWPETVWPQWRFGHSDGLASDSLASDSSSLPQCGIGGTFLYRRVNGVFDATKQWYYCCDLKWCFMCDIMFLLFQYLRSYFPFSPSFSISCFCCFNTYTDNSPRILIKILVGKFSGKYIWWFWKSLSISIRIVFKNF